MIETFFPIQWPESMALTKKRSLEKNPADWADEYGHIARLSRLSKWRKCIVSSMYDPTLRKVVSDHRGVVVQIENENGRKLSYCCDKYFSPSSNLKEIRKRLDAERAMSKLWVRVVVKG